MEVLMKMCKTELTIDKEKYAIQQADFYVATDGDDGNPGTKDRPFATLHRARDAVRELKSQQGLKKPVTVLVRGGKYFLENTLVLSDGDSGTRQCPISYKAYPGEHPILSGGQKVIGWEPYKGKILRGELSNGKVSVSEARQLSFNGELQTRARLPNFDPEKNPFSGGWINIEGPAEPGSHIAFKYKPGTFPRSWAKPFEGEVSGLMGNIGWCNNVIPIASIDEKNQIVTLAHELWRSGNDNFERYRNMPFQCYSDEVCNKFFVENILEELDQPGEWCLDSEEGIIYFWPPQELTDDSEVVIPKLDCLINLEGASYVTISGFTFTETTSGNNYHRWGLEGYGAMFPIKGWKYCGESVHLKNTEFCTIENSRFYALGGNAIYLEGYNLKNQIRGNTFSYIGANGVVLIGTSEHHPLFNRVLNNHFHHTGWILNYTAAIFLGMKVFIWMTGLAIALSMEISSSVLIAVLWCTAVRIT